MSHDVFISYSSEDKAVADATCAVLERNGVRCWIAPRDVTAGKDWSEAIVDAIHGSRAFVLIFSGSANASPQVKREVERAVSLGLPVIPVRIEDVRPSKALEYFISTPHWMDAMSPPLERHLESLSTAVKALLVPAEPEVAEPPRPATRSAPPVAPVASEPPASGPRVIPVKWLGIGGAGLAVVTVAATAIVVALLLRRGTGDKGVAPPPSAPVATAVATSAPVVTAVVSSEPVATAVVSSAPVATAVVSSKPVGSVIAVRPPASSIVGLSPSISLPGRPRPLDMVRIAGGTFLYQGKPYALDPFELDVTEVTVEAYAACVKARRCSPAEKPGGCRANMSLLDHPITCVDWSQAKTFCEWKFRRLPSAQEWEYAARGGAESRTYPWGNEPPQSQLCWKKEDPRKADQDSTCPVRSFPAGAFGLYDMAGNVWEWTATPGEGSGRVACPGQRWYVNRGGAWDTQENELAEIRGASTGLVGGCSSAASNKIGLRCARTP